MDAPGMRRLLDVSHARLRRAWLAALVHVLGKNPVETIAGRIRVVPTADVLIGYDDAVRSFAAAERHAFAGAAGAEARWLGHHAGHGAGDARLTSVRKALLHFDPATTSSVHWAERNTLDLVRELTDDQRESVQRALIDGARTAENPYDTARRIRGSIGLTSKQEQVVQNYRGELQRGEYAAALARKLSSGVSDRVIARAGEAGKSLTKSQIDAAVHRYRENYIRLRSSTIARTESTRVAHQGSDELYRQIIDRGDVDRDQLAQTWIHHRAPNERDFHVVMDGQTRAWGEKFKSGLGNLLAYPGDPEAPAEETIHCKCTRTVRVAGLTPHAAAPQSSESLVDEAMAEDGGMSNAPASAAPEIVTETDRNRRAAERAAAPEPDEIDVDLADLEEPEQEAQLARPPVVVIEATPAEEIEIDVTDLSEPPRDVAIASDAPAPSGFESIEYNGDLYYRHKVTGVAYTPAQLAERGDDHYRLILTGPNRQIAGYEAIEGRSPRMAERGEPAAIRYRSLVSGNTYTPEQVASGEAAEVEDFLREEERRPTPRRNLLRRIRDAVLGA